MFLKCIFMPNNNISYSFIIHAILYCKLYCLECEVTIYRRYRIVVVTDKQIQNKIGYLISSMIRF